MREICIEKKDSGGRLDKLLFKYLDNASPSFVYKMLRKKNIVLNDKKATGKEILNDGDVIKLYLSEDTIVKFMKESGLNMNSTSVSSFFDPDIIYEDNNLICVNKPVGVLSQKATEEDVSMNEICLKYMLDSGKISETDLNLFRPSIINRLDRNTSGLLLFAKNYLAANVLSKALKDRDIHKYYYCIVSGCLKKPVLVNGYLIKDEKNNKVSISETKNDKASFIETRIIPVRVCNNISLLEIELITGKTHQIRAHLASISHPIIGDYKYGIRRINDYYKNEYGINYQLLFSHKVVFSKMKDDFEYLSNKVIEAKMPHIYKEILDGDMEKPRS